MPAKLDREIQHIIDSCVEKNRTQKECEKIAWGHVNKEKKDSPKPEKKDERLNRT